MTVDQSGHVEVTLQRGDGQQPRLRFERHYAHPVSRVWQATADDAQFSAWFGLERRIDALTPGSTVRLAFPGGEPQEGELAEVTPETRFAFTWDSEELSFELDGDEDGTTVVFTTTVADPEHIPYSAAGYHLSMEGLHLFLEDAAGRPVDDSTLPSFDALAEHYARKW